MSLIHKNHKNKKLSRHGISDFSLAIVVAALVLFGLLMLSSAGSVVGYETYGDAYWYVKHQFISGVCVGIVPLIFLMYFPYQRLKKYALPIFIGSLALLVAVLIPGIGVSYGSGAHSWLNIGFSVQPSELVKLALIIYLAALFSTKNADDSVDANKRLTQLLGTLALVGVLVALQPDIGTLVIISGIALAMYFFAGGGWFSIGGLGAAGLAALLLLIKVAPYRTKRLTTFLHPELDPQGIGYHINQAFLALGSGGLWGRGFTNSLQKYRYLPEVTGDSLFAIIGEEFGFIGSFFVITAFLFFVLRGFSLMRRTSDTFGKLLVGGIVSWIGMQAFINIGAMAGIFPLTGIPLPFMSFGGTAMVAELAGVGILLNISRQNSKSKFL